MMYFKLSIRNARRSFTNYFLYIVTMTALLAVMEISNCIAIMGKTAGFQAVSFPLLITFILIVLVGYIDTFLLKQRAKEFANYLLLGMKKSKLTNLFLCEILLIGYFCLLAGTAIGFALYAFFCFSVSFHGMEVDGFLYVKSLFYTFSYFCFVEMINAFQIKHRLGRLQIRELMYEKNRSQSVKNKDNYKNRGIVFLVSFVCLIGLVCGIAFLPENDIVPLVSVVAVPLLVSVFAFYQWILGFLYAHRRKQSADLYQKDRLYIMAAMTSNIKTASITNAVFCICFLFSAVSFITGLLILQPEIRLFDEKLQQWMGILQIGIYIVFTVIYFSILSLHQIIELKQNAKNLRILHYIGKNSRRVNMLVTQQITMKLFFPIIMALLLFSFCIPLLNRKMNAVLPDTMHNALFQLTGWFMLCTLLFCLCYFFVIFVMGRQYINSSKHSF